MNEEWKGVGYCKARHVREHDDYCNDPTKGPDYEYCAVCTCSVRGCRNGWSHMWPLIAGEPKLCSKHYNDPPPSFLSLVRASQEPPDDFDIPEL